MNTNYNDIELKDLLEWKGEKVVKHGNRRYRLIDHDSLILQGSFFVWNSQATKGNFYTLLKVMYDMDKREAKNTVDKFIKDVERGIFKPSQTVNYLERSDRNKSFQRKENYEKIKEYLVGRRKIDEKIVESLYKNNLLYLDIRNNINFVIKDKKGIIKGEDLIGTGETRFKRNTTESYGFNIENNSNLTKEILYIFESPIDLLSYIEMYGKEMKEKHNEKGIRFLSTSGIRDDIIQNYIDANIKEMHICVDNDDGGDKFYNSIKEIYKDRDIKIEREVPKSKDWNEDLQDRKIDEKEKTDMKYEQINLFDSKESENKIEDKSEYLHKSIGIFYYTGSLKSLQFIVDVDNEKEEFTVYNSTNPFSYREYKIPFSKLDILGIEDGDYYTSKLISHKKETVEKKLNDYNIWKKENFSRKISEAQTIYYNNKEYTIWINKYNSITNKYDLFLDPIDENDWERPVIRYSDISELMDKVTFEKEELTKVSAEDKTSNYEEISKDKIKEKTTKKKQKEKGRER